MKLNKLFLIYGVLPIIFSLVSSVPMLLCSIEVSEEIKPIFTIMLALVFWCGLAAEQVLVWMLNKKRIKDISYKRRDDRITKPGVISFCKTKTGTASDVLFAVSFVVYVVLFIGNWGIDFAQYLFLFLIVLSFRVHCIANGKNYRYILYLQKKEKGRY